MCLHRTILLEVLDETKNELVAVNIQSSLGSNTSLSDLYYLKAQKQSFLSKKGNTDWKLPLMHELFTKFLNLSAEAETL